MGRRRGEEKEPLLLLHIQKETTGSISINYTPLQFAFLNLEATSRHLNACGDWIHPHFVAKNKKILDGLAVFVASIESP